MKCNFLKMNVIGVLLFSLASCSRTVKPFEGRKLSDGKIGVEYSESIANGTEDMYYDLDYDSVLPEGLVLYDDGLLKGTPREAGDFTFKAVMIDLDDKEYYADFSITIESGEISYSSFNLPNGKVGDPYIQNLGTATGVPNITYALKDGDSLPSGLALSSDGSLSGIPEEETTDLVFHVIASSESANSKEVKFKLTILPGEKKDEDLGHIIFEDFDLPNGLVGTEYNQSIRNAYGVKNIKYTFRFSSNGGLPAGLKADKELGMITGTPTDSTEGTIKFRVIASAEGCESVTANVTMRIDDVYVETTRFETEYVDSIPHLSGAGYSSSPSGKGMIQTMPLTSNGYVLGYLNKPVTVKFKIQAENDTTAKLSVGLGSENGGFDYDNTKFKITVNDSELSYGSFHVNQIGTAESNYQTEKHSLSPNISLKKGDNTISFEIKESSEATGTFSAVGCLFDYIDIENTDGKVGWRPRVANC